MVAIALGAAAVAFGAAPSPVSADDCAASTSATDLDVFFAADDAAGMAGGDYPHAFGLPDGRTLWMFQDACSAGTGCWATTSSPTTPRSCRRVRASGRCRPPAASGTAWVGSWVETGLSHWFWPLDAEVGADGNLWLFLAEVRNDNGSGAAEGAEPVATWRARFRLPTSRSSTWSRRATRPPPCSGTGGLRRHVLYLYGHCYRQFVPGDDDGFDPSCSPSAYLARVPRARLDDPFEYWTGSGWSADPSAKAPVLTGRRSMPVSVERFGDVYVAASDEDDWFGSAVVIRTATASAGPVDRGAPLHAGHEVR